MKTNEKNESKTTNDDSFGSGLIYGYFNTATLSNYSAAEKSTETASSN